MLILICLSCDSDNLNYKIVNIYWLVATDTRSGLTFLYFVDTQTVVTYRVTGSNGEFDTLRAFSDLIIPTSWAMISKDSIEIKGLVYKVVDMTDSVMLLERNNKMMILYAVSDPHKYANKLIDYKIRIR